MFTKMIGICLCLFAISCNGGGDSELTQTPSPAPSPGGGSGADGGETAPSLVERTLVAPDIRNGSEFGLGMRELSNGNIVIIEGYSSLANRGGSVHLINAKTGEIISTYEGDNSFDAIGDVSHGIIALSNGNYVITSPEDDIGGVGGAGSVKLFNGVSGDIISSIDGETQNDSLGSSGVFELSNGNYVICSNSDNSGGLVDNGSIIIADGTTGVVINTVAGDSTSDQLGSKCGFSLGNGHFIVRSHLDDSLAMISDAGSIKTISESTGVVISTFEGAALGNGVGGGDVINLGSGKIAVGVSTVSTGMNMFNGVVYIIDTMTGAALHTVAGTNDFDFFSDNGLFNLGNGNFVVGTNFDSTLAASGGSVTLVNGTTGAIIASHIGDDANDRYGQDGIVVMPNGNFAFASASDDVGAFANLGSVRIIDGSTGVEIGAFIGDGAGDSFSSDGIVALANNNIAVASSSFFFGIIVEAGRITLLDGSDATEIISIYGDDDLDNLGNGGVIALANGNFLGLAKLEDNDGVDDRGAIRLIDGTNGNIITLIEGEAADDLEDTKVFPFGDHYAVITLPESNAGFGKTIVLDGSTGNIIKTINGASPGDQSTSSFLELTGGVAVSLQEYTQGMVSGAGVVEIIPTP